MFDSQIFQVFLLFLTCVRIRCDDYYTDDDVNLPSMFRDSCNLETQAALAEIKSNVQDLQSLVVALREKIEPDIKLPTPDAS